MSAIEHLNGRQFFHGTPNGEVGSTVAAYGVHVGTHEAAKQALEAKIGRPATGSWDGTRTYGQTLVRSTGAGYGIMNPQGSEPHLPTGEATYPGGSPVPMDVKPNIVPVSITGRMTNTPQTPHDDFRANGMMAGQLKRGRARSGYFYSNVGEDAGSVSAVVPSAAHLKRLDR